MTIKMIDDAGKVRTIRVSVIENAVLNPGYIILDKGERDDIPTVVRLADIISIKD